jgi:hypothetical protein
MSPRFRPVIRVFVSSTFSDLKEERNALQRDVFPRLEHYCLVRGFQFQAIDRIRLSNAPCCAADFHVALDS